MKSNKIFTLLLALLMTMPLMSCENTENIAETDETDALPAQPEILTHIFRPTEIPLPDGFEINKNVTPVYDKETGELKIVCQATREVTAEDGTVTYENEYRAITLDAEYNITEDELLPTPTFVSGRFDEDEFIYVYNEYDFETGIKPFYIGIYNFTDETNRTSTDITEHFSSPDAGTRYFNIKEAEIDSEGRIFVYGNDEMAVGELIAFDKDFRRVLTFTSNAWITELSSAADGTIYIAGNLNYGMGLYPIDPKTAAVGKHITVGNTTMFDDTFFADGYDLYYYADQSLWGYTAETGAYEEVMSYTNSNVTENDITILSVIDSETLLIAERDAATSLDKLMLYQKAPDIDLSTVPVIEIATADGLAERTSPEIVKYNKNHPEVRVVVTDYSLYNSKEDREAGMKKLATDILTGGYTPDIVEGDIASSLMQQIIENELYADLYTFMDSDDYITREDLFSSIQRTFDDDGRMWGITDSYYVKTLIGTPDTLNGMTSWTLEEMLDFAMDLPEDKEFMSALSREDYAIKRLFPNGSQYRAFIDFENHTADFETPLFKKYLEFYESLPAVHIYDPEVPYTALRLAGHYAVDDVTVHSIMSWMGWEASYDTEDYVVIGFPTKSKDESGSLVIPENTYVILDSSDKPKDAWDALKAIIAPEYTRYGYYMMGLPILKSVYDMMIIDDMKLEYSLNYNGGATASSYDPENPTDPATLAEPRRITYFNEEKAAKLKDFLDNSAGAPYKHNIPDELSAIIKEEIQAYLGGITTAEECAKVVQSRVSIWLSEHE